MSESLGHNEGFHVLPEIVCEAIPASSPEFKAGAPPLRPSRKLFTVEICFPLEGRGTILAPGFKPDSVENFHVGDRVRLRRPDASELGIAIAGLSFNPRPNGEWSVFVFLNLPESEVPIGTEVWSA